MIEFEKIRRDTLIFLNGNLPAEEQRTSTQQLIASINEAIALGCANALKQYDDAKKNPQSPLQDDQ